VKTQISIENLNVYYEGNHILKNIDLEIPEKQITAIIGPSGCGKSTLLKSLNRMIDLENDVKVTGSVYVDGVNIFDKRIDAIDVRKKIGVIAQTPNPLPMSIYDNVAYGSRIHGVKEKTELNQVVERCLRAAGLWSEVNDRLKQPASKLSIGQQQRLCIARALAVEPQVLLFDEPTSALDPISTRHIEEQLLTLKKDYTTVFVTHILRQARKIADYAVFIYMGKVVEHGTAEEIFMTPRKTKTKAYIKDEIDYSI
jgi:phosphate transport system ATP-binding protein